MSSRTWACMSAFDVLQTTPSLRRIDRIWSRLIHRTSSTASDSRGCSLHCNAIVASPGDAINGAPFDSTRLRSSRSLTIPEVPRIVPAYALALVALALPMNELLECGDNPSESGSCSPNGQSTSYSPSRTARARVCHMERRNACLRTALRASGSTSHASPSCRKASALLGSNAASSCPPPPLCLNAPSSSEEQEPSFCRAASSTFAFACHSVERLTICRISSASHVSTPISSASANKAEANFSFGRLVSLGCGTGGPKEYGTSSCVAHSGHK
mmetsp:Transcript_32531/g.85452  ORF Transcript_32531/g.85452 Transcript_32531/m.85452 type:complete len:272 (+) Transcript_32531:1582-2397(+)